jgi:hypothetical protein
VTLKFELIAMPGSLDFRWAEQPQRHARLEEIIDDTEIWGEYERRGVQLKRRKVGDELVVAGKLVSVCKSFYRA